MPRIKISNHNRKKPISWQQTITDRIRAGKVVPLISNRLTNNLVLGGHDRLVEGYAHYSRYPLESKSLSQMAQFRNLIDDSIADALALKEDYVNFVKNWIFELAEADGLSEDLLEEVNEEFDDIGFSDFYTRLEYPHFSVGRSHPLLILASFPLPIYITTSYHGFVESALIYAGKRPRTEICRWHQELEKLPSVFDEEYQPSTEEPLVYHLYGYDKHPDSMVLTEDDYLRFLVACSQNVGRSTDAIHERVRHAMAESSLLLLGYDLEEWDFRSLFWGLIVPRTRQLTSVVSVQLIPDEVQKSFLQKYLDEFEFRIHWGDIHDYTKKLHNEVVL